MAKKCLLLDLGMHPYEKTWMLQHRLVELRAGSRIPDVLLLVEHEHVFTLGKSGSESNIMDRSIPVYRVERGGDATYHGPGQLVGYPIMSINELGMGVRQYVERLEDAIRMAIEGFGLRAERFHGRPGVWVNGKKVASIGIALRNWVTFHGFAINVHPDMRYFRLIRPCGMDSDVMASMEMLLGYRPSMEDVKAAVARCFSRAFGLELRSPGLYEFRKFINKVFKYYLSFL